MNCRGRCGSPFSRAGWSDTFWRERPRKRLLRPVRGDCRHSHGLPDLQGGCPCCVDGRDYNRPIGPARAEPGLPMTTSTGLTSAPSRRAFLRSCAGHLASAGAFAPITRRLAWAQQPAEGVIATAPFGYLQRVANGVWALVSTPLRGVQNNAVQRGTGRGEVRRGGHRGVLRPQPGQHGWRPVRRS